MIARTLAEERLVEAVNTWLPNYRPGDLCVSAKENAEFQGMTDVELDAITWPGPPSNRARTLRRTTERPAEGLFPVFCVPVGLVSTGLLMSIEIGHQAGGLAMPFSPIVAATVLSRSLAGVTAGRVAALLSAALFVYALETIDLNRNLIWVLGSAVSLIACSLGERVMVATRASKPPRSKRGPLQNC